MLRQTRVGVALLPGILAVAVSQSVFGLGASCCEPLSRALPGRVVTRTSNATHYAAVNGNRWSETTILAPSCIVTPHTSDEVASAIKVLQCRKCKFAIKSGGHMTVPGANNIDGGVSLDLSAIHEVTVSPDKSYVRLGAGGSWNNAYDQLVGTGVMVPGGICGGTGVGGVTLGGGQSFYQPKVGWVVDNVLNLDVVLASGQIVNANQTSHPDLFKALKGGSSNFGIVTHVNLKAFGLDELWAGEIMLPADPDVVARTLSVTTNFTTQNNENTQAGVQVGVIYLSNGLGFVNVAVASTNGCENPEVLRPYTELQPQIGNTVRRRTMSDLIKEIELLQPGGFRQLVATVTFRNDEETIQKVQAINEAMYRSAKALVYNLDWITLYSPQPKVMQTYSESCSAGGNSLGLDGLDHDQVVVLIMPRWTDAEDDAVMNAAAKAWVQGIEKATRDLGTADPWLYLNFAAPFQKPLCSYGDKSLDFLRQVAKQYDPSGVFQKLVPGGFRLSEACSTCS